VAYTYEYPRPAVTVDVVMLTLVAVDLAVLCVKRGAPPFKGGWALPGGFVDENEPLALAAARELEEETGVRGVTLEQLGAFGDPGRDPRGHTVSVAFLTFVVAAQHRLRAGDDAADVAWMPLRKLARTRMAFDHARILDVARARMREHLNAPRRTAAFDLVPSRFTLTELQRVHEAVLGRTLDKRNFRARLVARGLVEPVAAAQRTGPHRPAQLYRWKARPRR